MAVVYLFYVVLDYLACYKSLLGLRVDANEEYLGLDKSEMGLEAYPEERVIPEYTMAQDA